MSRRYEIVGRSKVYDGYFQLEEVTFRHTRVDGSLSHPINRVVLDVGEVAAGIVVRPAAQRIILIEQFRFPTTLNGSGWLVEIVAGRVDPGETAEEAFRREALEEIGYEVENVRQIHRFYPAAGTLMEHMTLFYAEAGSKVGRGGGTDHDEDIRVFERSYQEFFNALDDGQLIDAKTIIAGQWLRAQSL